MNNIFNYKFITRSFSFFLGLFLFTVFVVLITSEVSAQAPYMNYQGKVTNATSSMAVADGDYDMVFRLYTQASGGSPVWTESRTGGNQVAVENGLFSVMLGDISTLSGVDFTETLYLGVTIGADSEMSPRKQLGTVPAAFEARNAEFFGGLATTTFVRNDTASEIEVNAASTLFTINQIGSGDVLEILSSGTTALFVANDGFVGIGTSTPSSRLTVAGDAFITGALRDSTNSPGTAGYILQTTGSGTEWVATSTLGFSTVTSLFDLTDTSISSLATGQILQYDGTDWVNVATSTLGIGGGVSAFTDLTDVDISSLNSNRLIFTNSSGTALVDSADLTFNSGRLTIGSEIVINNSLFTANSSGLFLGVETGFSGGGSGDVNFAIGIQALSDLTTGGSNIAIGNQSGRRITTGSFNTIIGPNFAGDNLTEGIQNTFIGHGSGFANQIGGRNAFFGFHAGYSALGDANTFIGVESAGRIATTSSSVALGIEAAQGAESGFPHEAQRFTIIGGQAGRNIADGADHNVFLGYRAGYNVSSGANNLLLGYQAGDNLTTGSNNLIIGYDIDAPSATASNQMSIGNLIFGTGIDGTGTTISSGNIGVGTSSPSSRFSVAGDAFITGALRDSTNSPGTAGYILQTTGSGTEWVATSTLGFTGGTSVWNESGSDIYYTAGNVGIGTSTPTSRLTIDRTGITGNTTGGITQYLEFTNSSASEVVFGNLSEIVNAPSIANTLVGNMFRVEDNTSFSNTIRGIEVQADRGTNTQGENTALSGFARTFGVRGVTRGDAGGVFEPAGGFFATEGTTQGNAIRGFSSTITSANMFVLNQEVSSFTGTGMRMNFGTGGGSFTGDFIDVRNNGVRQFYVTATGTVYVAGSLLDSVGNAGATGQVLQSTGSGIEWVATSSLGITGGGGGGGSFTSLSDTQSSLSANRLIFTNSGGTALTDSSNLTFSSTGRLTISGNQELALGDRLIRFEGTSDALRNIAIGRNPTLGSVGQRSVAIGDRSLESVIPVTEGFGNNNIAIGAEAGRDTTTGVNNIFIGAWGTGLSNTTGISNTFIGYAAGFWNTEGGGNTFVGMSSGNELRSGDNNTFLGEFSGTNIATSSYSVALGSDAAFGSSGLPEAQRFTIIGGEAGRNIADGADHNVFLGYRAGYNVSSGANNLLLGYQAGDNLTTGSSNLIIGYDIDAPSATASNQMSIGNLIFGTDIDGTGTTISSGNIGIGVSNPSAQLHTTGSVRFATFGSGTLETDASGNLSVSSDESLKIISGSYSDGLNAIREINPIIYQWNELSGLTKGQDTIGFSAQNIASVIPDAVGVDGNGFLTLSTRPILAALVNATKEQQVVFDALLAEHDPSNSIFTDGMLSDAHENSLWAKLTELLSGFKDGVLTLVGIQTERVQTEELCLDDVCLTANDLRNLLESTSSPVPSSSQNTPPPPQTQPPAEEDSYQENNATTTGSESEGVDSDNTNNEEDESVDVDDDTHATEQENNSESDLGTDEGVEYTGGEIDTTSNGQDGGDIDLNEEE